MKPKTGRFFVFFLLVSIGYVRSQPLIQVNLVVTTRESFKNLTEAGLLVDVSNLTNQDLALYTPLGKLVNYIKYYKLNQQTGQYVEIIHPYYQEFARNDAFQDSVYKATGVIVDIINIDNYNSKSKLYQDFVKNDSLWYDYSFRSSQYEKEITGKDIENFKTLVGLRGVSVSFTLLKAKERFQDFFNIDFIYKVKGDYKISLELPITQPVNCLVGPFNVKTGKEVKSNDIYLSIR